MLQWRIAGLHGLGKNTPLFTKGPLFPDTVDESKQANLRN